MGDFSDASNRYKSHVPFGFNRAAKRTADMSGSRTSQQSGETVNFSAGAAGTTGKAAIGYAPITDSAHGVIGNPSNTSFAWVTGTILTNEVEYRIDLSDAVQLAAMANGDYAINYDTGELRYKKATAGTSDTCNYWTRMANVDVHADIEVATTMLAGAKVIATAGSPEPLAASTASKGVTIKARVANTGVVKVGNASSQNLPLEAGESIPIQIDDLSKIYLDVTVNGEGVDYTGVA